MSFDYNSSGLRTKKTVNGEVKQYFYSGDLLVSEYDGIEYTNFTYGPNGEPVGFSFFDVESNEPMGYYYYLKNIQGDIIGLIDFKGEIECTYSYDAWGKFLGAYDENGIAITHPNSAALSNPLRYRGYYYDDETGLYYLNSRYYNPEWGTFISADGYVSTGEQIVAKNMYAYCLNNPVNYSDPSGAKPVDIDMVEGLGYILDIFEFAIQTSLGAVGYSYSTAVRPANIGAGIFNKQVAQAIEKNISRSLKVTEVFEFLGWLTLAIDLATTIEEHRYSDQSVGGILWDISVDASFTIVNFAITTKFSTAVGTAICPGLGTAVGAALGIAATVVVGVGLEFISQSPRRMFKSWIN